MSNYETQVHNATDPRAAMVTVARGLDEIIALLEDQQQPAQPSDPWGAWAPGYGPPTDGVLEGRATVVQDLKAETAEVGLPPVAPERMAQRRQFAEETLQLNDMLKPKGIDWVETYSKGGPRWLYYSDRDSFMMYPDAVKSAMVRDIMLDSPEEAAEIGRDVIKQPCTVPDVGIGERAIAIGEVK